VRFCLLCFSTSTSTHRVFTESLEKHAGSATKTLWASATSRVVWPKNADAGKTLSERNLMPTSQPFRMRV